MKKKKDKHILFGRLYVPAGFYEMVTNKRKIKEQRKYGFYALLVILLMIIWFLVMIMWISRGG